MGRLRGERGQATNEYVALLALVAIAIAALAGISASGIGSGVLAGLQRGICLVAPGPCPRIVAVRDDLAPCPVSKRTSRERLSETIAIVELGSSGTLRATGHSDGTVTITLADGSEVGATFRFGAHAAAGREVGGGGRGRAGIDWGSGRSWKLPNEAAAADFVARFGDKATIKGKLVDQVRSRCSLICDALGWRPHEQLPEPDETFEEGGASARLQTGFGLGGRPGEMSAKAGAVLGRRIARDGTTTWYVQLSSEAAAQLDLSAGELALAGAGEAVLSYEVGADGEPLSVGVAVVGGVSGNGGADAEARGRGAAGAGGKGAGRAGLRSLAGGLGELAGGVVDLEAKLDLADPANYAAGRAVLDGLFDPGAYAQMPGRVRALGERIVAGTQIDARLYTQRSSSQKYGADVALGVGIGGAFERSSEQLDLLAAFTRLPGLPFLARDDCR
ncbi:hypothetical protein VSS74_12740 [Conexibacter stalactiti]|uniref:DUF2125 domain-containing protein n=1 Tax=Conexibacter stalactiti TaxID=1940611 RepID=A0ABU4HPH5_9ACTN|nr:hypothetical protein [Conexibacter stalactiti]MDW5595210.1 hypothetical protein [Conexibacter stalactiti]MEC5035852.1 hypothetical protein [Conexibacter stalactiti]